MKYNLTKKYNVTNRTTGFSHICYKLTFNNIDYYLSDQPTQSGDYWYNLHDNKTGKYGENQINIPQSPYVKKLIATTNKSIDVPQIIDEAINLAKACGYNWENTETSARRVFEMWQMSKENHFNKEDMTDFEYFCTKHYKSKVLPKKSFDVLFDEFLDNKLKLIYCEST